MMFTSTAGREGPPGQPKYAAANGGIVGLMRSPAPPDGIAPVVGCLASDGAAQITGQGIHAGGTQVSGWSQPALPRTLSGREPGSPGTPAAAWDRAVGQDWLRRLGALRILWLPVLVS